MSGMALKPRGGKVTKPTPPRQRGRPPRASQNLVASQVDPELENVVDEEIHDEQHDFNAASLAAAAAQHATQEQLEQQQQMDLSAAAILANSHDPDLGQHQGEPPEPHTTEALAHDSGYANVVVESALAKRLSREPGMRLAQQRRPEQILNLARRSNVEALFAHIAGDMAPVPCKNCHKGHGPWTTCVVVDGQMCGSCANCWFNASGARCSFHDTRNPQAHAHGGTVMANDASFNMQIPPAALGGFNYVSAPASADPVVRYTIERSMADIRAADKKTRHMLMIEAAAKQLAFQVVSYEEALQEEQQQQQQQHQPPPQAMMEDNDAQ